MTEIEEKVINFRKFKKNNVVKQTNSYWFLLPALKLDKTKLKGQGLVNVYLDNHLLEYNYKNSIHLIFKQPIYNSYFKQYTENVLTKHKYFYDIYDTEGDGDIGVVFMLPDNFKEVIDLFKNGKYSKFPDWYKNEYFTKYKLDGKNYTDEWEIFMKHENKRKYLENKLNEPIPQENEVWDITLPENEIYMFNNNIKIDWI